MNTKMLLALFLIAATAIPAGAAGQAGPVTGQTAPGAARVLGLRTVTDVENRFTISVPATWHVQTSTGDPAVEADAPAAPAGATPDSVNVIVRDMPVPLSPESCVQEAGRVLRYVLHAYTTVSQGPDKIGDRPAYAHAYIWRTKAGEERWSVMECVTEGRRAFVMIGTTQNSPDRVRKELPVLTTIIGTLRLAVVQPEAPKTGPKSNEKR